MKTGLYARVSSEKQDIDLSISSQLKALREYAARNGHEVVKEFVDEAESGKTSARPAFREMVSMARRPSKPLELILVWKYSRFARSRVVSQVKLPPILKLMFHPVSQVTNRLIIV